MAVFGLSGQVCSDAHIVQLRAHDLDVFSARSRSGPEILGHSDLTGTWLLLLFLLRSHDFCLFLPRALETKRTSHVPKTMMRWSVFFVLVQ